MSFLGKNLNFSIKVDAMIIDEPHKIIVSFQMPKLFSTFVH
jgi:hypothetical protein